MKYIILIIILAASALGQTLRTPGVNGENIVNPAFRNAVFDGSNIDATEFGHLNGVSSNIQTQLNGKLSATLLDSDTMTGATASNVPSAESVKAYVDANAGGSSGTINISQAPYNAVGDAKIGDGGVMTAGNPLLTVSGQNFVDADIGKFIRVVGAGTAGADLVTTISARSSSSVVTLAANAATTVSSAQIFFGTNNTTAVQAAIDAANASETVRTVLIPEGKFFFNVVSYPNVRIVGVGGLVGQSEFSAISLANLNGFSIALPALRTLPVIRFESAASMEIAKICFVGCVGTSPTDRFGSAIQVGDPLNTVNGPVAAGFRITQVEVTGFLRGMTFSRCWDSVVEMCQVNFCTVGFFGGELTSVGADSNSGPADGMSFISCGSNWTDTVFNLLGSKQSVIMCGDFNRMQKLAQLDGSSLVVTNVNLETVTVAMFHLVAGSGPSNLEVGHILNLNLTGDGVLNESPNSNFVSIKTAAASFTYKTTMSDGYPIFLPQSATIVRCTDTTFATAFRTELASFIYRVTTENATNISEDFVRRSSPFGSLGWIGTAIAGTAAQYTSENNQFKIYIDGVSKYIRFAPEYAFMDFNGNWRMSIFINPSDTSTTIFRCGLYSVDTSSPTLTPTNGIGMRMDTSAPNSDTTVRLEVIVGGVVQTTVDTGITLATMNNANTEVILERQANTIRLYLRDTNKLRRAAQVAYSGTLPNSFCAPAILMGGTSGARQVLFRSLKIVK